LLRPNLGNAADAAAVGGRQKACHAGAKAIVHPLMAPKAARADASGRKDSDLKVIKEPMERAKDMITAGK